MGAHRRGVYRRGRPRFAEDMRRSCKREANFTVLFLEKGLPEVQLYDIMKKNFIMKNTQEEKLK